MAAKKTAKKAAAKAAKKGAAKKAVKTGVPKADQYVALVQAMTKAQVVQLWQQVLARTVPAPWPAGKALEYLIVRAFELEGAEVVWPFSVRDPDTNDELEQIDGVVYAGGLAVVVEAKDFDDKSNVNIEPIAKLRSQLLRRPSGVLGAIFSRTGFTLAAVQLAPFTAPQTVVLWGREDLDLALRKGRMVDGLVAKYRKAVEKALPNYDLALEAW